MAFEATRFCRVATRACQFLWARVERVQVQVGARRIGTPESWRHVRREQAVFVARRLRGRALDAIRGGRQVKRRAAHAVCAVFAAIGGADKLSRTTPGADRVQHERGGRKADGAVGGGHMVRDQAGEGDRVLGEERAVVVDSFGSETTLYSQPTSLVQNVNSKPKGVIRILATGN